jgi:hypothetical protein
MKYSELEHALQAICQTAGDRTIVTSKVPAHGHDLISVTRMEGGYRLSDVEGAAVEHAFGNSSCLMCAADFFSKIQRASFGSRGFKGATPTGSKTTAGNLCIGDAKSSPKSSPKSSSPKGGMPRAKLVQKVKFPKKSTKDEKKKLKAAIKAAAEETMKLNAKETALDLRTFRQNKTALLQKRPELIAIEQVRAVFGNLVRSVVVEPHFLSQHEMDVRLAAAHKKVSKPYFIEELLGRMRAYAINVRELTGSTMPIVGGIQAEDRNHALVLMALMGMAKILQCDFNVTETILLQLTQFDNLHTEFHRPDPVMNNAMKLHFAVMYKGGLPKTTKVAMAKESAKEAKDALVAAVAAVAPAQELARQAAAAVTAADEASSDDEPLEAFGHPARLLGR